MQLPTPWFPLNYHSGRSQRITGGASSRGTCSRDCFAGQCELECRSTHCVAARPQAPCASTILRLMLSPIPRFASLSDRQFVQRRRSRYEVDGGTVNILWVFANFVFAYVLLLRVGHFDPRLSPASHHAAGALLISLQLARHFGELHGGNTPERP
jgi:hypothetical protein